MVRAALALIFQAALAAGIFHRGEVAISAVKEHLESRKIPARLGA